MVALLINDCESDTVNMVIENHNFDMVKLVGNNVYEVLEIRTSLTW